MLTCVVKSTGTLLAVIYTLITSSFQQQLLPYYSVLESHSRLLFFIAASALFHAESQSARWLSFSPLRNPKTTEKYGHLWKAY
jgi:hypothetical protein